MKAKQRRAQPDRTAIFRANRSRVECLQRRLAYLKRAVERTPLSKMADYHKAEISALTWVLGMVRTRYPELFEPSEHRRAESVSASWTPGGWPPVKE